MKAILKAIRAIMASMKFVVRQVFKAGKWVSEVVVERVLVPLAHVADASIDVIERVAGLPLRILRGGSPAPTVSPAPLEPSKPTRSQPDQPVKPVTDDISSFGHALSIKRAIKQYLSDDPCVKEITHPVVLRLFASCVAHGNSSLIKMHKSTLMQIADHLDGKSKIEGVPSMAECLKIEKTKEYEQVLREFRYLNLPKKPELVSVKPQSLQFPFNPRYVVKQA